MATAAMSSSRLFPRWYQEMPPLSGSISQATAAEPDTAAQAEESSLLKGTGVSIGWGASSDASIWSMPRSGESLFRSRLYEVKGQPSGIRGRAPAPLPAAEVEPVTPVATPVPGKPGFVELTFDPRGLPYIDVRGLPPGLEVQIADPLEMGKAIRFRIPGEAE